jgi:hypothetical protein
LISLYYRSVDRKETPNQSVRQPLEESQSKLPREEYIRLALQQFLRESPHQTNPQNTILRKYSLFIMSNEEKEL